MIGLALLVSVRALAPFAAKITPKTPDSFAAEDMTPLAVKSDRLIAADDAVVTDKATVKIVKVAFPPSGRQGSDQRGRRQKILCEHARTSAPSPSL